ncbi:phage tail sheath family protein [Bacillus sp. FSL W8-0223]|uniref:phage tail sheath family protein n=1 Tax=Bacillus sp. FSL W8-0223 TaxID=2954595 RepID=UPI0030F7787E
MAYQHGVQIIEQQTPAEPSRSLSAVQVVFGTAPVNLIEDPKSAVNVPILVETLEDVKEKIGYGYDFDDYTLNQSVYASFELFNVAPIVLVNVLDPDIHKTTVSNKTVTISKKMATIDDDGVLLDSVEVKDASGTTTFQKDTDYTLSFDENGKAVIGVLSTGAIGSATTLSVTFDKLDPSAVTKEDIIGGYDVETGKYSGIELIRKVFPQLNVLPAQLLAPGWSHYPEVAAVLAAKSTNINGNFSVMNILDIDSSTVKKYEDVQAWKETNGYNKKESIPLWPKVKANGKKLWYSAVYAARVAQTDAENDGVPFVSPSNKSLPIDATVLADGTEVFLDQPDANVLNSIGVVTAINFNGWRTWGNNTAAYPELTEPQDRFIAVRRVFQWWGNSFILAFFDKVDDPTNKRLIESVVDAENIRANGFSGRGQIPGATIEFRESMNPTDAILNGKIVFIQKIGAYTPAESITNILEFDPTITAKAALGG